VFSGAGLFDETLPLQADVEFFMRVLARYPLAVVDKSLSYYRRHENNITKDLKTVEPSIKLIAERMLRFPDNYPAGAGRFYCEILKRLFVDKGRALAHEKRQSPL
jgi:hypothetical protein